MAETIKILIFASTISATPLYNAYHGGTYFFADGTIYKAAYKYCRPNVGVEE